MKILFALSASVIDRLISQYDLVHKNYESIIQSLYEKSLFVTFGFDLNQCNHKLSVFNSEILQKKWLDEYGEISANWKISALKQQIEQFDPDVLYTNNPDFFTREVFNELPAIPLKVLWRAAPLENISLDHFDLGLSYSPLYADLMHNSGIKNTDLMQFSFDKHIHRRYLSVKERYDFTFAGSYHWMFTRRNKILSKVAKRRFLGNRFRYFIDASGSSFNQRLPSFISLFSEHQVYLSEYLSVIAMSRIVLNCHSDISENQKGNMRVFETLGMKRFMITDEGSYPQYFKPEKDFITFRDTRDLLSKLDYYLKNVTERKEIAEHGFQTLSNHYDLSQSQKTLASIFQKYL